MLPAIISQCVVALKDTSLGCTSSRPASPGSASRSTSSSHNQVPTIIVIAAIYIVVNLLLTLARHVGAEEVRRARRSRSRSPMVGDRRRRGAPTQPVRALTGQRFFSVTQSLITPSITTSPSARTPRTRTGQVGVVAGPLLGVGLGDAGDVGVGLGGVGDLHPLGDPPLVARDGRLGERTHRGLEPVAERDRVHGLDVVVHAAPLGDHQLGAVGPDRR